MPPRGSWNTRASSRARSAAPCAVTSAPAIAIRPAEARAVPASTLSSVDLPAPLLPITVTNWPLRNREVDPAQRARLQDRARVEGDLDALELDHRAGAHRASSFARVAGRIRATPTRIAVTRFRSEASSPRKSASSASATTIR